MDSAWLTFICAQPLLQLFRHWFPLIWQVKAAASVTGYHLATLQDFLDHSSTTGCVGSRVRAGDIFVPCELLGRCYLPYRVPERRRYFQAVQSTCWFLARSGEFRMQSVSPLVTGSSPSLAHQVFLKENQNNIPVRVKTWRKILHLQRCSEMEGGTALPPCCLWASHHFHDHDLTKCPLKPEGTFQPYRWMSDCAHWHLGNTLNSLQISCGHQGIHKCLSFYRPE